MQTEQVLITPKLANEMLEKNDINRPMSEVYAKFLANEMLEGRWRENTGIPILINGDGTIIDGQHRLLAVKIANRPTRFTVTSGVKKDVIDVIDTGRLRSASDVLKMQGVTDYTVVSSIIKFWYMDGTTHGKANGVRYISNRELQEEYNKDPKFWANIATTAISLYKQFRPLPKSFYGGCMALALRESKFPTKVMPFFTQLASGENCSDAVLILRRKLINNQLNPRKYTAATKRDMVKSYFNAYIKNQKNPYSHPDNIWL
jgi:hypothetical protein